MKIQDTEDINAKRNENKSYQWQEKDHICIWNAWRRNQNRTRYSLERKGDVEIANIYIVSWESFTQYSQQDKALKL